MSSFRLETFGRRHIFFLCAVYPKCEKYGKPALASVTPISDQAPCYCSRDTDPVNVRVPLTNTADAHIQHHIFCGGNIMFLFSPA